MIEPINKRYAELFRTLQQVSLSSSEFAIVLVIFYLNQHEIRTSRNYLASYSHMSLRSVDANLTTLVNRGFLVKQLHVADDRANLSTTYTINHAAIQEAR
jgi:DNA-binding MarR family transcriptional regulator